jgi:hypothetical protein
MGAVNAWLLTVLNFLSFIKCVVLPVYLSDYMLLKRNLFHEISYIHSYRKNAINRVIIDVMQCYLK